jgi:hypothetical protein
LDVNPALKTQVIEALQKDLDTINSFLPRKSSRFLKQKMKVLIETNRNWGGGTYHPSANWLKDNGYPEYWAKSI